MSNISTWTRAVSGTGTPNVNEHITEGHVLISGIEDGKMGEVHLAKTFAQEILARIWCTQLWELLNGAEMRIELKEE